MSREKFQVNQFRIVGENDKKHALQIIVVIDYISYNLYPPSDYFVSHVIRRFLSRFSTDFHEILYGLFASHSATTAVFSTGRDFASITHVEVKCLLFFQGSETNVSSYFLSVLNTRRQLHAQRSNVSFFSREVRQMSPPIFWLC